MDFIICLNCRGYKVFDVECLKKDDFVYFYMKTLEKKEVLKKGIIIKKLEEEFIVSDGLRRYRLSKKLIYPYDAPARIVYKIFGTCNC